MSTTRTPSFFSYLAILGLLCAGLSTFALSDGEGGKDVSPTPGFWSRVGSGTADALKATGGFLSTSSTFFHPHYEQLTPVFEKETMYFKVVVEDDDAGRRHLVFLPRRGAQAVWRPGHPEELVSCFMRTSFLALPLLDRPPAHVLFIGLGGGLMPTFLRRHFPHAEMDIVELDGGIPEIAEAYFGFVKDAKTRVIIEDGRFFLNRCERKYDLVFIDAYNAEAIPFQLTTTECYRRIRNVLTPDGVLAVNIANLGDQDFIASELKTIREVFPAMTVFVCGNASNYVPVARASDSRLPDRPLFAEKSAAFERDQHWEYNLSELAETMMPEEELADLLARGTALTDDHAPVGLRGNATRQPLIQGGAQ